MNTHKLFEKLNGVIRLTSSKREKLKNSRSALRNKINKFFEEKGWKKPEFHLRVLFRYKPILTLSELRKTGLLRKNTIWMMEFISLPLNRTEGHLVSIITV